MRIDINLDKKIMLSEKNFLRLLCVLLLGIIATGCSGSDEKEEIPTSIVLSVDKNNLKSDGVESVTFSVKANNKDITNSAVIIYIEENTPLSGKNFSTNIPGTYTFFATFENLSSSNVEINAMPIFLILTADTTIIKNNGKSSATFSATADGSDVTDNIEIFLINEDTEILLEEKMFTTYQEGSYTFYCKYNNHISNNIIITAEQYSLTLRASASSINANGIETVALTVFADNDDITNEAIIYRKDGDNQILLEGNTFETSQEGDYEFFAQYQNQTSNTVNVKATIPKLLLTSDKTIAKTGEEITFTSILDETNNISSEATLHITFNNNNETIKGNVFKPVSFGTYYVLATYEDKISNTIQLEISPANITLLVDKNTLKSRNADFATFTVYADGKEINDANIFLKKETQDILINGNTFSSNVTGSFSFYAQYAGTKSDLTEIIVQFVNFAKVSCAMEVVATWCGYSPHMINAFHQVHKYHSDQINIVSIHRSNSYLGSSDIDSDEIMKKFQATGTPFGIVDLEEEPYTRSVGAILDARRITSYRHLATSGIAITSQRKDNNINVTLKIKVNETNQYNVCAIIVEDNIVKQQVVYVNNSKDNVLNDEHFVHHSVATYIMPNANLITGKPLGLLQEGSEITETFSISLDKSVTKDRIINYSNCRVIAYVLKTEDGTLYFNNSATCPVNGSVDFRYEE